MFRIEAVRACALCLGALSTLASAPASAQDGAGDEDSEGPGPVDTTQSISAGADLDIRRAGVAQPTGTPGHASGTYTGVVPGAANPQPAAGQAEHAPHVVKGGPTITWPGFQMRPDGSSRVFIQSTAPLEPKAHSAENGKFELELPRARVAEKTNRLPLDTRFFNTPVTKVSVSVARSGAVVQLELRAPVTPQVSTEAGAAGYFFTYIELPKGEYLKGANASSGDKVPTLQMAKPSSKVIGKAASTPSAPSSPSPNVQGEASVRGAIKLGH